ncbi:MAG TPA: glycosyltransferase family 92 protein [Acidobacteriaceae bacterium]|jgi:hypothetical protein
MSLYFKLREKVRFNPIVQRVYYSAGNIRNSGRSPLVARIENRARKVPGPAKGAAICTRIKDEAPYLVEWLEYYRAAGASHAFVYESFSSDDFREVLRPYVEEGFVTLMAEWPTIPVSPYAEEDCVLRCVNRYAWVGFFDVDEFLVCRDGASLDELLARYQDHPAVAFHYYMYGTSGHKTRPPGPVIRSFVRREMKANRHIKVFVQPNAVTRYRNAHSWFYKGLRHAVTEAGDPVYGSVSLKCSVKNAFLAHFYTRSEDEYLAKARKSEAVDKVAMKFRRRSEEMLRENLARWNQVEDLAVQDYYRKRCEAMGLEPVLLHP